MKDIEKVGKLPFTRKTMHEMLGEKPEEKEAAPKTTQPIKEDKAKEQKQERIIFWTVIGIIAIFAFFLLWKLFIPVQDGEGTEYVIYNDNYFTKEGLFWVTQWVRNDTVYNLPFRYNPYEVLDVKLEGILDERFHQGRIYITHDPAEHNLSYVAISAIAFSESMVRAFNIMPVAACTKQETEGCIDRPIIDCTAQNASVIYLRDAAPTRIILNGNCMTVQGEKEELLRATDRVLLRWYKIL